MSDFLSEGEKAISDADWSEKPLVALTQMARADDFLAWKTEQFVSDARGTGASWNDIANALGVTRQTAWRKYAHTID